MEQLPPIPTPRAQRWREFRIQVLPIIVFLVLLTAAVFMWKNFVQPVAVVGTVEAINANVISLQEGQLVELSVQRFDKVNEGDVIGIVRQSDDETIRASIAAVDADLKVMRARMATDERRREQDYQQFRMDLMDQKVLLAKARVGLIQSSNSLWRAIPLIRADDPAISEDEYDRLKADYESFLVEVHERTGLVQEMEEIVDQMPQAQTPTTEDPIEQAIKAQEREIEIMLQPVKLRAPIGGYVSVVFKRPGEKVVTGEPIVTISAGEAERIVGYLRPPISTFPTTNDMVKIRTRSQPPKEATAPILRVGAQVELIAPGLFSSDANRIEYGLPILVALPPGMNVVPGEFVDLSIQPVKR